MLKIYNYYEEVKEDVMNLIDENIDLKDLTGMSRQTVYDKIKELVYYSDVTGNLVGSYFCNHYEAKEAVTSGNNLKLASEAYATFEMKDVFCDDLIKEDYEKIDIIIREHILYESVMYETVNEIMDALEDLEESKEFKSNSIIA